MTESPNPLKVLVLDQARGVWGAQQYLLRLAPLLRDHGVELTLAAPRELELHEVWRAAGFDAIHVDLPIVRSIRTGDRVAVAGAVREARRSAAMVRSIARLAKRGGFDAIWSNAHWTHLEASLAGRRSGTPVVLHLHEEATPGLATWLRAGSVGIASRAVAVSRAVARGLPVCAQDRVQVIANGVDTAVMSPPSTADARRVGEVRESFGIGAGDIMVLAATRLDPVKRIEDLIGSVVRLNDSRLRLVIAGGTSGYPDYVEGLRAQAGAAGGSVMFCGNRTDIVDLFRASDIVLHSGVVEGMPLGLIEAQACGKPVVAYSIAGVPEAVVDGVTGLLAAARDVEGLRIALGRLAVDADLRSRMGTAARVHAVAHHDIADQAAQNARLVADLCRRR